jgi:hypothetical protein
MALFGQIEVRQQRHLCPKNRSLQAVTIAIKVENLDTGRPLTGKVSLVTGSTSGIGLGIARALAVAGCEVVLNGFGRPEDISEVQQAIAAEFKVRVSYSSADMSKPDAASSTLPRRMAWWLHHISRPMSPQSTALSD